jgi:hypothetical protein
MDKNPKTTLQDLMKKEPRVIISSEPVSFNIKSGSVE